MSKVNPLNEIIEELENNENAEDVPSQIAILPPENHQTTVTMVCVYLINT